MLNKKLLAVASLVAILSASNVFAKTEGNYVGVDLLRTSVDAQYEPTNGYKKFGNNGIGVGLHYNHAFNHKGMFLAPGVFVEKNAVTSRDRDGDNVIEI